LVTINTYIDLLRLIEGDTHEFLHPVLLKLPYIFFYFIVFLIGIKKESRTGMKLISDTGYVVRVTGYVLRVAGYVVRVSGYEVRGTSERLARRQYG